MYNYSTSYINRGAMVLRNSRLGKILGMFVFHSNDKQWAFQYFDNNGSVSQAGTQAVLEVLATLNKHFPECNLNPLDYDNVKTQAQLNYYKRKQEEKPKK